MKTPRRIPTVSTRAPRGLMMSVVAAVVVSLAASCQGPPDLEVTFESAPQLEPGSPCVWAGRPVGEVIEIGQEGGAAVVRLRLRPEYRGTLPSAMTALVTAHEGTPVVELFVLDPDAPRLPPGGRIAGVASRWELVGRQAKALGRHLFEGFEGAAVELSDHLDRLARDPRLEDLADVLAGAAREAKALADDPDRARQKLRDLRRAIEERLAGLRDRGLGATARRLREELDAIERSVEPTPRPAP